MTEWGQGKRILCEAILCTIALMVFSFFIHHEFPVMLFSFAALAAVSLIIGKNIRTSYDLRRYTGELSVLRIPFIFSLAGFLCGLFLSVLYRYHLDQNLLPDSFHGFGIIAGIIGVAEEMVFRGFIQGSVRQVNVPASVLLGTLSHTGYKCCLFLSPAIAGNIDIGYLAFWTFGAGIVLGVLRQISKSIIPCLVAHGLFDILVYAGFSAAPWWVW
jgi:membrane protease YdiL (CAAX protease family)